MAALIDSSPECVVNEEGYSEDDIADFILNDNYEECASIMTFGPGSTYGPDGVGAAGAYVALTWIGIIFIVGCLVAWVWLEHRRLTGREVMLRNRDRGAPS
jgi:hypothetical protein